MKRLVYIDFLRVISVFSVVAIHVAITAIAVFPGKSIEHISNYSNADLLLSWLQVNVNRFCVPTFVMITGLLLLNPEKNISIIDVLKKYIWRVFFVIMFFGTIFAFIEIMFSMPNTSIVSNIICSFKYALIGKSWDHLWYLYMLIGLYLLLPLVKIFVKYTTQEQLLYLITMGVILTSLTPLLKSLFMIDIGLYLPINSIFIFYLLWGYYLGTYTLKYENVFIISGIIGLGLICLFTYLFIYKKVEIYNEIIYPYSSPFLFSLSTSIFILFKRMNDFLNRYYTKFIQLVSRCSFGIYIYHILFIHLVYKFLKFNPYQHNTLLVFIALTFIVFFLALFTTYITIKLPFFKKYI